MAKQYISIEQIFDGMMPSANFGKEGQYLAGIGIDPDMPVTDSAVKTGGVIRPVKYAKFSGSEVNSHPVAIITNPKNELTYTILRNGKLISHTSGLGTEVLVGTVAGSQASHGFYYNNYIYILGTGASHDDVSRYGPLDGSPSLVDNVWKGSTLGTQTALVDSTYPATRHSVQFLNHFGWGHIDNKAYFLDYKAGVGYVHFIKTLKTSAEGDTNDGSTYGALDLPYGYLPMVGESYGNDVVVAGSPGTGTVITQGRAVLFFWNTADDSFYRAVPLPDPICTGLKYDNGILYGISGNLSGGVRLWRYVGGDTIETLKYIEEGHPPLQSAVDYFGNRIAWGAFGSYPVPFAGLLAYGSKSDLFPRGLHNIAVSSLTPSASNGLITAVRQVEQGGALPRFVIGGTDGSNTNLDKKSTTYGTHVWRSRVFNIGRNFSVTRIFLPLTAAVAANMTIVPKLIFDYETASATGTTINSTNYPNSEKRIKMSSDNFANGTSGKNNFCLELTFSGTALIGVGLPILIELEVEGTE